jgi:putative acetyltransferase
MKIRRATKDDFEAMTEVWHSAVKETHAFIHKSEIEGYRARLSTEFFPSTHEIWVATDEDESVIGFIGMNDDEVGMLFVDAEHHGEGVGTALIDLVTEGRPVLEVEVNEQATQAVGFYTALGFEMVSRSPVDSDGNPFPLLRMRRPGVDSV